MKPVGTDLRRFLTRASLYFAQPPVYSVSPAHESGELRSYHAEIGFHPQIRGSVVVSIIVSLSSRGSRDSWGTRGGAPPPADWRDRVTDAMPM